MVFMKDSLEASVIPDCFIMADNVEICKVKNNSFNSEKKNVQ